MKVYELINSEEKWCKEAYAIDENNVRISSIGVLGKRIENKVKLIAYCVVGAYIIAYGVTVSEAEDRLSNLLGVQETYITEWNDEHDWEFVYNKMKEKNI